MSASPGSQSNRGAGYRWIRASVELPLFTDPDWRSQIVTSNRGPILDESEPDAALHAQLSARGLRRPPQAPELDITICDLKLASSRQEIWNMKSAGNLMALRFTL